MCLKDILAADVVTHSNSGVLLSSHIQSAAHSDDLCAAGDGRFNDIPPLCNGTSGAVQAQECFQALHSHSPQPQDPPDSSPRLGPHTDLPVPPAHIPGASSPRARGRAAGGGRRLPDARGVTGLGAGAAQKLA